MSVNFNRDGAVARVCIDRQASLNAIDRATLNELLAVWREVEQDESLRAVVLTGAGDRAFCAGADMKSDQDEDADGLAYWASMPESGFGGISLRTSLDIPVVARVNGHALGGGMEMVLGCDIVVASSKATFGLPEPRVGRLPMDGGVGLIARRLPHAQAMGLLLTGRRISAQDAFHMGLVNEVVEPAGLDEAVDRWLADILACAPLPLRAIKQMARAAATRTANELNMLRLPALVATLASKDQVEGVEAFRDKRRPQWLGR